jgi:alpha-N-arabinofuranosidase
MPAFNLGTRGLAEAADLHEYANHPGGTELSDRRRANGAAEPFGFRIWCLGNEMDGPWQIGHKTADEYGRLAAETARFLRMSEESLELVVAGSSALDMPTFGAWERTVLRHTTGLVDHVSVHAYYEELDGDGASFLASGVALDRYLDTVAAIVDEVGATRPDGRPVGIAVDEWNVWYLSRWNSADQAAHRAAGWHEAPRLLEDDYSVTDAVVVGSLLISLLRHADRVSVANLAQLVNAIAPIRCEPGGPAWRQATFFPFALTAALARGRVVPVEVGAPSVPTARYGSVPVVDAVATVADDGTVAVFAVNRSLTDAVSLDAVLGASVSLVSASGVWAPDGGDRLSVNTAGREWVSPRPSEDARSAVADAGTRLSATLPPVSWSVFTLAPAGGVPGGAGA